MAGTRTKLLIVLTLGLLTAGLASATPAVATATPTVTKVAPNSGPTRAGTRVVVYGRNFTHVRAVRFGRVNGTRIKVLSSTKLLVTAPAQRAGLVDIRVLTSGGASRVTARDRYIYIGAPTISAVTPASGPTAGGTRVQVSGSNFRAVTAVTFGVSAGTAIAVASPTSLLVTAPAGSSGAVDVRVTTRYGVSAAVVADHYIYIAPPAVSSVSPASGSTAGGARVTVSGSGFVGISEVTFSGVPGTSVAVTSASSLMVTAPAHNAGSVDIQVTSPYGRSAAVAADQFHYAGVPGPVTGITTTPDSTSVSLGWTNPASPDFAGVMIRRAPGATPPASPIGGTLVTDTTGPTHAYTDTGLAPNTQYSYALFAHNAFGEHAPPGGTTTSTLPPAHIGTLSVVAGCGIDTTKPAASNCLRGSQAIAIDSAGNLFIADSGNNVVEKVTPGGVLSVVAGNGTLGNLAPGPATSSPLDFPHGVAVDGANNLYFAEGSGTSGLIVKVTPSGTLSVVAGSGGSGAPVPGPATSSPLSGSGVALDATGNLFIADSVNNVVEKVTTGGTLSVVAGTGTAGAPVPGPALSSPLRNPGGVAVDNAGNLLIADSNNSVVEKVTPSGTLSVVAGTGSWGAPVAGPATSSPLTNPNGVAIDSAGNLFIADSINSVVEKVASGGTLSVIAGTGTSGAPAGGPATSSPLTFPSDVAVDSAGDLFIGDRGAVERVTAGGTLSVVAGEGQYPVPGLASSSPLSGPSGVAVDHTGNVFIADSGNNVVEKVTPGGVLSVVAGTGAAGAPVAGPATSSPLSFPSGVAVDGAGNLFIADTNNSVVERVTPGGVLSVVAGTGSAGAPVAGPATSSPLSGPSGVAVDHTGNVFIADSGNNVVEKVTPGGVLSVVAGTGAAGAPVAGPATSSPLSFPSGVAVDGAGNLFIADTNNSVVERVTPGGILSVVAGNGSSGSPVPGPATSSPIGVSGVAVDSAGNLYATDSGSSVVVRVTPGGILSVAAGTGGSGVPVPGPATSSPLSSPSGMAVDSAGNLYIADTGNNMVEKVTP